MPVVTVRVAEADKRKMDELKEINWSEVIRKAIEAKIREEEAWHRVDSSKLRKAAAATDELRRKVEGWDSLSEIRKWRRSHVDSGS